MSNVRTAKGIDKQYIIKNIPRGVSMWTVPWAYDPKTKLLNEDFPAYDERGGTVQMKVTRNPDGTFDIDAFGFEY